MMYLSVTIKASQRLWADTRKLIESSERFRLEHLQDNIAHIAYCPIENITLAGRCMNGYTQV
jgi:hypothetical protein